MPVSLNPKDALKGFDIQAGLHRVVSSEWMVHTFVNKEGQASEPFVVWAIGYLPIDEKGAAIGDVQISYELKVAPAYGETIDKAKFAPASAPGQPLPLRVGSRGPYLEPVSSQTQLSDRSKAMLFIKELVKCDWDVDGKWAAMNYSAGALVGTEGEIYRLVSENDGTDAAGQKMKATQIAAFKKINKYGYEVQGASHTNAVPAPSTAAAPASSNGTGAHALAVEILAKVVTAAKSKGTKKMTRGEIIKQVLPTAAKVSPRPTSEAREAAKTLLASDNFYEHDDVTAIGVLDGDEVEFND